MGFPFSAAYFMSSKSTISNIQSVDDQIEELTEKIRNEIIKELTNPQERSEYESKLFSLKKELFSEKPDASNFKKLFNTLGFFGDIEGSISLMARVWPFLYPLLQIAIDRAMI